MKAVNTDADFLPRHAAQRSGSSNSRYLSGTMREPPLKPASREASSLAGANKIGVVDRGKRQQIATWPLAYVVSALALDESRHRLFAGGRNPAKLIVLDTVSGKEIAELDCVSGIDDLWYDTARRRIYATGTDGLAVYDQKDADHYQTIGKIPTRGGSGTSFWCPELDRYYVAAPMTGKEQAGILVFAPED